MGWWILNDYGFDWYWLIVVLIDTDSSRYSGNLSFLIIPWQLWIQSQRFLLWYYHCWMLCWLLLMNIEEYLERLDTETLSRVFLRNYCIQIDCHPKEILKKIRTKEGNLFNDILFWIHNTFFDHSFITLFFFFILQAH